MLAEQTEVEMINLTPAAVEAVRGLLEKRNLEGYALRVFVSGSGCSGLQYGMALEANVREQDLAREIDGIKVVVDEVSVNYMRGSTVDYVETPSGSGFKVENPNEPPACGCGDSYRSESGCSGCG